MTITDHSAVPPIGWHGARFLEGPDASKGLPEVAGQIYATTDLTPRLVYMAKADLSGWDILFPIGVSSTPGFIGVQGSRSPAQTISDNTNTTIDHTSDSLVYDYGTVKPAGVEYVIPVGYGGIWRVSVIGRMNNPTGAGPYLFDIENSIGSGAGVASQEGYVSGNPSEQIAMNFQGDFEWSAGDTFNLRVFQNTGGNMTLNYYRLSAHLIGVP